MSTSIFQEDPNGSSKPIAESTRISPFTPKDEKSYSKQKNLLDSSSFMDESIAADSSSYLYAKEPMHLQKELSGLNNRLQTYMERVKQNEEIIIKKDKSIKNMEEELSKVRSDALQQVNMLRTEINESVKKAVLAEHNEAETKRQLDEARSQVERLNREVITRRERESTLDNQLVAERNALKYLREEMSQLTKQNTNEKLYKENLQKQVTDLKLQLASLQENAKITAFELTIQENRVSETERKLQYSSEDVVRKLSEQRDRLDKAHLASTEQLRQKHRSELERIRKDFNKKLQDTLTTYVSSEEFAKLETISKENLRRFNEAQQLVVLRDEQLKAAKVELDRLTDSHQKELASEKKRRERLNKRLLLQSRSHEDIRQELETYRKLIEGLDTEGDLFPSSPIGAKRPRTSLEALTPKKEVLEKSIEGTPNSLEARRILLKRALTPNKKKRDFFFGLI